MNEQEEILVRQSKWSGRRVVLLYWFAFVFLGTAAAAGLGSSVLNPKYKISQDPNHDGITEPWHADDCSPCHDDIIAAWEDTKHSYVIEEFTNATGTYIVHTKGNITTNTYVYNATQWILDGGCCHVTRWTNDTSVIPSGNVTIWDYGISCAACHVEPGAPYNNSAYATDPGTGFPFKKTCAGRCHLPGSRGSTWASSPHVDSLSDLLADPAAEDSCLHCMSGQGLYTDPADLSLTDTTLTSVDCVTCHDPHNVDGYNAHDLRIGNATELCGTCHVEAKEMMTDTPLTMYNTTTGKITCTDCHGYQWEPGYYNESWLAGNYSGYYDEAWIEGYFPGIDHSLVTPDDAADCGRCHGALNATKWNTKEANQMALDVLYDTCDVKLGNVTAAVDAVSLTPGADASAISDAYALIDEAEALMEFVVMDGSDGFHNPDLATAKLELALAKLDEAYVKALAAIGEEVTCPTTEECPECPTTEECPEPTECPTCPETTDCPTCPPTTECPTTTTTTEAGASPGFELIGALLVFSMLGLFLAFKKRR
ncbi:MAG: hypothetical protein JSV04_12935 [Candidatus Heimdallarchaeota archaeon]|nr:MAG: hypothetical protein JSV04_12935 [Candidatus Heimdallarchaeota archaeon]